MRRLRTALQTAVVAGVIVVAGPASGQTTTTTSSTTVAPTTTTTVTPTTVAVTTTTTVAHPCADRLCTAEAPGAVLSTPSTEIVADRGSHCWREPTGPLTRCVALAAVPGYKPPLLVVTQGEVVAVRFTAPIALVPEDVALVVGGERLALSAANPTQFRVDLAPGVHENVSLSTRWLQGEVPYFFRLEVRPPPAVPPTPPGGRTLALTG